MKVENTDYLPQSTHLFLWFGLHLASYRFAVSIIAVIPDENIIQIVIDA